MEIFDCGWCECFEIRKQITQQGFWFCCFRSTRRWFCWMRDDVDGVTVVRSESKPHNKVFDFVVFDQQDVDFVEWEMMWTEWLLWDQKANYTTRFLILLYQRWYGQGDCLFWNRKVNYAARYWFCWWERASIAGWLCWCVSDFLDILFLWSLSDMPRHIAMHALCVHPNFYKLGEKQSDQAFLIQG